MPIYEYRCADCDERFERYVRAWGDGVSCPSCQGSAVEKQLSTFAFSGVGPGQDGGYSGSVGGGCGCGRGGCGCAH